MKQDFNDLYDALEVYGCAYIFQEFESEDDEQPITMTWEQQEDESVFTQEEGLDYVEESDLED